MKAARKYTRAEECAMMAQYVASGKVTRCPSESEVARLGARIPPMPFRDANEAASWLNAQGMQPLSATLTPGVWHLSIGHGQYKRITPRQIVERANKLRLERMAQAGKPA